MLLVLLTLLGMAATTTSTLEIMIADNDRDYKVNFYNAESAAIQAAVIMENQANPNGEMKGQGTTWGPANENWLNTYQAANRTDMSVLNNWDDLTDPNYAGSLPEWSATQTNTNIDGVDSNGRIITAYAAEFIGIGPGDSLNAAPDGSRKFSYVIYGHSQSGNGRALIEVGYKREF